MTTTEDRLTAAHDAIRDALAWGFQGEAVEGLSGLHRWAEAHAVLPAEQVASRQDDLYEYGEILLSNGQFRPATRTRSDGSVVYETATSPKDRRSGEGGSRYRKATYDQAATFLPSAR